MELNTLHFTWLEWNWLCGWQMCDTFLSFFVAVFSLLCGKMLRCIVALCLLGLSWAQDCQVANIQTMQNFDKTRVSRKYKEMFKFCEHIDCISTVSSFFIRNRLENPLEGSQYESLYSTNLICSVKSSLIKKNTECKDDLHVDSFLIVCRDMVCCWKEGPRRFILNWQHCGPVYYWRRWPNDCQSNGQSQHPQVSYLLATCSMLKLVWFLLLSCFVITSSLFDL